MRCGPNRGAWLLAMLLAGWLGLAGASRAQHVEALSPDPSQQPAGPKRIHLILKEGTYQVVTRYQVVGSVVRYVSAERDGETEEIPLSLVDLDATKRWEKQHTPSAGGTAANGDGQNGAAQGGAAQIDPELLKEEEERRSLTPTVAPDLTLPEQDSVLALDTWQGTPELAPLVQTDGDLNRTTGHSLLKKALNPMAAPHMLVQLKGTRSYVQLHVDSPVFYLRVGDDSATPTGGTPLTVDTHGANASDAKGEASGGAATSQYVIVRLDVRTDARILTSFNLAMVGDPHYKEDVVEVRGEPMPGGHWTKLMPAEALSFGEYALMEIVSDREVNLGVWDFGVHPAAPENRDVIRPQPRPPSQLERRKPEPEAESPHAAAEGS